MGVLPYKDSTGICRAKNPHFSALTTWATPKDLLFKNIQIFVPAADRKDPPFKKIYVSLLFLAPKLLFSLQGAALKAPPFSVRGRSLSPPIFKPCAAHIYTNFIFEYPLATTLAKPNPTGPGVMGAGIVAGKELCNDLVFIVTLLLRAQTWKYY